MFLADPSEPYQPRKSSRRDPWTEAEAREALSAARRSGKSFAAFAREHGLPEHQLYWWHARIRTHPDAGSRRLSFVQVAVAPQDLPDGASGIEVVVGGAVLRLGRDFCEQTLARAVGVLRGMPC